MTAHPPQPSPLGRPATTTSAATRLPARRPVLVGMGVGVSALLSYVLLGVAYWVAHGFDGGTRNGGPEWVWDAAARALLAASLLAPLVGLAVGMQRRCKHH